MKPYIMIIIVLVGITNGYSQSKPQYRMLGLDWQITPMEKAEHITSIITVGDTLYIGRQEYGIWKSGDLGQTFIPDPQLGGYGANPANGRRVLGLHNERDARLWVQISTSNNPGFYSLWRKALNRYQPQWEPVQRRMFKSFYIDTSNNDTTRYYTHGWTALSAIYQYPNDAIRAAEATKFAIDAAMRGFTLDPKDGTIYYYANQHVGVKDGLYRVDPADIRSPQRLPAVGLDIFSCHQLMISNRALWLQDHQGKLYLSTDQGRQFRCFSEHFTRSRKIDLLTALPGNKVLAWDEQNKLLLLLGRDRIEVLIGLKGSRVTASYFDARQRQIYVATTGTNRTVHGPVQLNAISLDAISQASMKARR